MNTRKFHEIWIGQCDATDEIKLRYGVEAAFDYLVAEKLLNFADAAASNPEFARELPRFVACVRSLFTPQEIRTQLERIEREQNEYHADNEQDDELDAEDELDKQDKLILENPAAAAERARRAVNEGKVSSINGKEVRVRADCICVHSDTPNAVEVARAVKAAVAEYLA